MFNKAPPKQAATAKQEDSTQDELYQPWKEKDRREMLVELIKTKKQKGEIPGEAKINDKLLAKEHFKYWLSVAPENKNYKLMSHPLLTVKDHQKINQIVSDMQSRQIKLTVGFTIATGAVYWMFWSRKDSFYRIFNNKNSYRVSNWAKKTIGLYAVFIGWMAVLSSHYQNAILQKINDQGLFSKYKISFNQRNY